ncbi:GatB/YqeY domain-containing protein [Candidatus Berkelbacteria bacterium]|nr:GatB/YqeY domain-containing protein [Candidatus Berkelbacteria bacterium]
MTLAEQIINDLTAAMKAQDKDRVLVLRMAKTALKNQEINLGETLTDEQTLKVIQKEVKQRRESQKEYEKANRPELAEKEAAEIKILEAYLPAQLSPEELAEIVDAAIKDADANSMQDMGKVMGIATKMVAGRADGSSISELVKQKLAD